MGAFLDNQDIWYKLFIPTLNFKITWDIPDWFSRCISNQLEFRKCTRFPIRYSFVAANLKSLSFFIHFVIHHWCFHRSSNRKNEKAWLAIIVVASSVPIKSDVDYTFLQRRFLLHCGRVYLLLHRNISENISKASKLSLIETCNFLGLLYLDQCKNAEAKDIYLQALAGFEKARGPDYKSTLDTVNNLGILYQKQDKVCKEYLKGGR